MIARPAAAALSCRGCQHALFRAVVATHSANAVQRTPLRAMPRTAPALLPTPRLYTSERTPSASTPRAVDQTTEDVDTDAAADDAADTQSGTPWFLEVEAPRHAASQHTVALPKTPEDSPDLLEPLIKYVYEDMGLDELALLDLRDLDPPAALGPNLIMLFATARSERHLHVSAGRLVKWLRRNHKVTAKAGGLIGPGELKTKLRRLRKKAKLMGTNTAIVPGGDNGISTGWVCVNFNAPGGETGETTTVDAAGKFSGFGSTLTGTTVVVQCMTESRRQELDLETLWQGILKRSLRAAEEVKGQGRPDDAKIQELVSSRIQLSTSPSALQWQALQQASQQKRHFSTSLRRMNGVTGEPQEKGALESELAMEEKSGGLESEAAMEEVAPTDPELLSLADLQRSISDLQVMTLPIPSEAMLTRLLSNVLLISLAEENSAKERLDLLDQILLTAHERGMKIMSSRILAVLIDGLVRSPAWGPETQRAQKNIEMLLSEKRKKLDEADSIMLMEAHALREDWDRFWDIFNWNTRFAVARHFSLYEVAFRKLAATGDDKLCLEALRTVWPEFRGEEPYADQLRLALAAARECVLVAQPISEQLVITPPDSKTNRGPAHKWYRHHEGRRIIVEIRAIQTVLSHGPDENTTVNLGELLAAANKANR